MGDQVDNVYELPMDYLNTSNHEYSIPTNVWNDELTDLYKASRTRDKLFVVMTVMQLICTSVAVVFIVLHVKDSGIDTRLTSKYSKTNNIWKDSGIATRLTSKYSKTNNIWKDSGIATRLTSKYSKKNNIWKDSGIATRLTHPNTAKKNNIWKDSGIATRLTHPNTAKKKQYMERQWYCYQADIQIQERQNTNKKNNIWKDSGIATRLTSKYK
ncbi:unnamed protein product [Mytilus coruscus]|uniref:Uncharacterized protein n=1 Tax=Mytilus coruscus TaxID=42192 RepID=A0A6J8BWA4_MYTCO|nr:unnamed protein product [Mytilus coruscus]